MKYIKFNAILFLCLFMGISCGPSYNNSDSSEEGEYEKTETEECEYCDGEGVIRIPCAWCDGTGETDSYYYEGGTARIACSSCNGTGGFVCAQCRGTDRRDCEHCSGTGIRTCDICHGNGRVSMPTLGVIDCPHCGGDGLITCFACNGKGIVDCGYCSDGKVMCERCWGNGYQKVPTTDSGTRKKTCKNCEGKKYFGKICQECNGEGEITVVKVYDSKTDRLIREERK